MDLKILLTGFEPFEGVTENPSEKIVNNLAVRADKLTGVDLVTSILPVVYSKSTTQLRDLLIEHRPRVLFSLGVAPKLVMPMLERVALNLNDATIPDNLGEVRSSVRIVPGGETAYFCDLPLTYLQGKLGEKGFEVGVSNHAGAYLCNHVFYLGSHMAHTGRLGTRVGFMHVPMPALGEDEQAGNGWTLEKMISLTEVTLMYIADYFG